MEIPKAELICVKVATQTDIVNLADSNSPPGSASHNEDCTATWSSVRSAPVLDSGIGEITVEVQDNSSPDEDPEKNCTTPCVKWRTSGIPSRIGSEIFQEPSQKIQWFQNAFAEMGQSDIILVKDLKLACKEFQV